MLRNPSPRQGYLWLCWGDSLPQRRPGQPAPDIPSISGVLRALALPAGPHVPKPSVPEPKPHLSVIDDSGDAAISARSQVTLQYSSIFRDTLSSKYAAAHARATLALSAGEDAGEVSWASAAFQALLHLLKLMSLALTSCARLISAVRELSPLCDAATASVSRRKRSSNRVISFWFNIVISPHDVTKGAGLPALLLCQLKEGAETVQGSLHTNNPVPTAVSCIIWFLRSMR